LLLAFAFILAFVVNYYSAAMLRRIPSTSDGKAVDRLQESIRINKPFKAPSLAKPAGGRDQPVRKRKRVSYKGAGGDDDDDDEQAKKKRKKDGFGDGAPPPDNTQHFPVFKPKPFGEHAARRFLIPEIKDKTGAVVAVVQTNISLGTRPPANIIPRPLHDPMEDHAIVLYDPTIDDRETEAEKHEREKEEARLKAEEDAKVKTQGLYNPHKPLKVLLNLGGDKKKKNDKVPVVIDPKLSKVLRPHQVEGVKVRPYAACMPTDTD
jgi:DNA repair and recombination RAD54-like protein